MDDIKPGRTFSPDPSDQPTSVPIGGGQPPVSQPDPLAVPESAAPAPMGININEPATPTPPPAEINPEIPETPSVPPPLTPKLPETPPLQTPTIPPPPNQPKPKSTGKLKSLLPWGLAVLFAVAAGLIFFLQSQQLTNLRSTTDSEKAVLNSKINSLETGKKQAPAAAPAEPAASTTDQQQITALLTADCEAEQNLKMFSVKEIKIEGTFATASNGCDLKTRTTARANTATLEKVKGAWVIVDEGTTPPTAAERARFGIPASLYD